MSDIEVGMYVKQNHSKHTRVGLVVDLLGDGTKTAMIEYQDRYGRDRTLEPVEISLLIHVCNRKVRQRFDYHYCGRPVKEGNLCGIHAAADRRVKENRERDRKAREDARHRRDEMIQLRARMEERINRLPVSYNIKVEDPATDTVTIPLSALEELIRYASS